MYRTRSRFVHPAVALLVTGCAGTQPFVDPAPGTALNRGSLGSRPEPAPMSATAPPRAMAEVESVAVPVDGSDLVRGRATVVIEAPLAEVRRHVTDYGSYSEFLPRQKRSQVLRKKRDGTHEVYLQWAALHGAMKVWVRAEMRPRQEGEVEIYESHILDGNVDDAAAVWRLRPIDEQRTEVTVELFLDPQFSMPTALINRGIVGGAADVATALRARIERR